MSNLGTAAIALAFTASSFAGVTEIPQIQVLGALAEVPGIVDRSATTVNIVLDRAVMSIDEEGDPQNEVLLFDLNVMLAPGETILITGLGWDVTLNASDLSVLDDLSLGFGSVGGSNQLGLVPGLGVFEPGQRAFASPLASITGPQYAGMPLTGDVLRVEFYEFFDDAPDQADGFWASGSVITLQYVIVPSPGVTALMGVAGMGIARRRRVR